MDVCIIIFANNNKDMKDWSWPLKVGILLLGLRYPLLGIGLIILDGRFHYTSNLERLKEESPDWIIARGVFGIDGLDERTHKLMAVLLIASSLITLVVPPNAFTDFYLQVVTPITLVIIATAITLKNLVLGDVFSSSKVAFL